MTLLPASLLPPLERPRMRSATSNESLTRAVLAALEHGTPFPLSVAADISAHQRHFHGIPKHTGAMLVCAVALGILSEAYPGARRNARARCAEVFNARNAGESKTKETP